MYRERRLSGRLVGRPLRDGWMGMTEVGFSLFLKDCDGTGHSAEIRSRDEQAELDSCWWTYKYVT